MSGMSRPDEIRHSVTLDKDKCKGCTNCIKRCPTEAIRVRKGLAHITSERCIDCGECIRTCPHHAKKAVTDSLQDIFAADWRIALPAPALLGQFPERFSVSRILTALTHLGFDDVVEVALGADMATRALAELLESGDHPVPLISSSCPAVVRLIQLRFPSLVSHVAPVLSPMELAARIAKERALAAGKTNVAAYFVGPCAAKVTAIRYPIGHAESALDGALSIKDVYLPLRAALAKCGEEIVPAASGPGIGWARGEGESDAVGDSDRIAVDGMENVIGVLEAIENGQLKDVAFVEAMACPGGCVGGPLAVENPYIAKTRVRNRERVLAHMVSGIEPVGMDASWSSALEATAALRLDGDMEKAMAMMEEMDALTASLPGLDCGSCGAPTCRALAEDIVRGLASVNDCVFKLRENVRNLAEEMLALERIDPPGLDRE